MMNQIALERRSFGFEPARTRTRASAAAPAVSPAKLFTFNGSHIETDGVIWRMKLREADYYSTGFAAGSLLRLANYPAVEFCRKPSVTLVFRLLQRMLRKHLAQIRVPERYLDELRGYADATGIPYTTLFMANFVFDVLKKLGLHCSSVVVSDAHAMLIGRNTDLLPSLGRLALKHFPSIVAEIAVPGKLPFVSVTPGFFLGAFNGYNARGVAVLSHQIGATKEEFIPGSLATTLLQRMLLEEATGMAHAESIIRENPIQRCISNLIVSTRERASCVFEIAPIGVAAFPGTGGHQCCVTHFEADELAKLHRKEPEASRSRLQLMNRIAAKSRATVADLIALVKNYDNGISHKDSGRSPTNDGTYQSLVFDIAGGRIFMADGARLPVSLTGTYRQISISFENTCRASEIQTKSTAVFSPA